MYNADASQEGDWRLASEKMTNWKPKSNHIVRPGVKLPTEAQRFFGVSVLGFFSQKAICTVSLTATVSNSNFMT